MGSRLSPQDQALYRRTDEVLHYVWDPIGVATVPTARDEYSGYALRVLGMLLESVEIQPLAAFLLEIEGESMGLTPKPEHAELVAELLVGWKRALTDKYSRSL